MKPLDTEVLDRFYAVHREAGSSLAQELSARLDEAGIREQLALLDLVPPPELLTLWKYGVPPEIGTSSTPGIYELTPAYSFFPPEYAVAKTQEYRDSELSEFISPSWLVIAEAEAWYFLVVDCSEQESVSRVYNFGETEVDLASHSIRALFERWADQIIRREYYIERARWVTDTDARGSVFTEEELEEQAP